MAANCKGGYCNVSALNLEEIKKISIAAYNFLEEFDPCEYKDGRYEFCDGIYVNIETYVTYPRIERKFESHEKYIDIQYMISGREIVTVAPAVFSTANCKLVRFQQCSDT